MFLLIYLYYVSIIYEKSQILDFRIKTYIFKLYYYVNLYLILISYNMYVTRCLLQFLINLKMNYNQKLFCL